MLCVGGKNNKKITFKICVSETLDGLEEFLVYDSQSRSASFVPKSKTDRNNSEWIFVPTYDPIDSFSSSKIEKTSQLLRLPKRESVAQKALSADQVVAIYVLHNDTKDELKIIESGDFFYGSLSSMLYEKGIELFAGDQCVLTISAFDGCEVKDVKTGSLLKTAKNKPLEIASSKGVLIKPLSLESTKTFGNILICLSKQKMLSSSGGSTKKLHELLQAGMNEPLYTDFALMVDATNPGTISVERSDKSPLFNAGGAGFASTLAGKVLLKAAGGELFQSVDRASRAIETFGEHIERSSKNIENALIVSSKTLGSSFEAVAMTLSSTLKHATNVFETTSRFVTTKLSSTALVMSADMVESSRILGQTITRASQDLSGALTTASENIKGAASEIKDGMKSAADSFKDAFEELKKALDGTSGALEKASDNFIKGMEKLENSAKALQKTYHKVDICVIQ